VASFTPAQIDGTEDRAITIPMRNGDARHFTGEVF
jgi:hypothetical protein